MKRNLLIFPGSTDLSIGRYEDRYNVVISEAKKHGYNDIHLISWTGQKSSKKEGAFSMQNALLDAIPEIEKYNGLKQNFDLIAFSWGCNIVLRSIQLMQNQLSYLNKVILWGLSPFWKEYEALEINKHDSLIGAYQNYGCLVDPDYLKYQIPIEYLLRSYKANILMKIGAGCLGKDFKFLEYIESIVDNDNISYHYLKKSDHLVTEPDSEYLDFLFN